MRLHQLVCSAALISASSIAVAQPVTLTLDQTVIAPKTRIGIGINAGGGWYNFVGAILVDDPSFEGPDGGNGFAHAGWPWYTGGEVTAAIDTSDFVSGAQSQRLTVTGAPAHMTQGRDALPQGPLIMTARPGHTYRVRVQAKADSAGARIRLGAVNDSWQREFGPELAVTTDWQVYEWDYQPASEHLLRGFAIGFEDNATYWVDDLVAWDVDDINPATGLSETYVSRLRELRPASLRLGGLGVNGIPLESYLRRLWELDYGPPALGPDMDLNTFLRLCREVGAQPFITVPPAFSDSTSWQIGDLTDDVIANVYEDHGNLIDYLGGDATTTYGARREADGFARWDQVFDEIYLELGNELWGTPDDNWDMDPNGGEDIAQEMQNYATYCEVRINEMKARPGWRSNMKVGWAGRSPTMWLGGWDGSYDGTLVPAIGGLVEFHTIDLYYGSGAASDSDDDIFGALFANAPKHEHELATMKAAYQAANGGVDIETTVYEGNATWGGYESDLGNPSPLYFKSVSLGAAVSLVDVYAACNRGGVTVNNHFHYGGNVWGATGPYPEVIRKPAFHALKLFTNHIQGDLVTCTVSGSGTYDSALEGEVGIPYVACYPYKEGELWYLLMINRHRSASQEVSISRRLAPMQRISLEGPDLNANNESAEVVTLTIQTLDGALVDEVSEALAPASAVVLVLSESGAPLQDAGVPDGASGADAATGQDALVGIDGSTFADAGGATDAGDGVDAATGADEETGCACVGGGRGAAGAWLCALLLVLGLRRRTTDD